MALTYEDFHSDDITQVKFHPTKSNVLYTASMDGTVCVVDTNISDEEEALLEGELNKRVFLTHTGINLEDPIQHIGFYGSQQEKIWISTHSERLSLYHEVSEEYEVELNCGRAYPYINSNHRDSCCLIHRRNLTISSLVPMMRRRTSCMSWLARTSEP